MLQSRMTLEEEEDVQNELASLQREAEVVRKHLLPRLSCTFPTSQLRSQTTAISHPPQLPSVPVAEPEVPEGPVALEGWFWHALPMQKTITSLVEELQQTQERVALPA
jgi:hypothetical protein